MGEFIIDREGFEELLARRKENIILNSKYIGRGNIDIWKLANKAGKFERSRKADFGEGIWFIKKSAAGQINLSDLRYGRGKSQLREDFPVAVRVPTYVIDYLKRQEKLEDIERGKIVVEQVGQVEGEGYVSVREGQGIPLIFLEFGMPDGKWHSLLDLLDVPEVRMRMEKQNKEEIAAAGSP